MSNKRQIHGILKENIPLLADEYFKIVLEKPECRMYGTESERRIVSAFENIVGKLPVSHTEVQVQTTQDVIKAVCDGAITIPEAKDLMELFRSQMEIDVIPELADKLALLVDRK